MKLKKEVITRNKELYSIFPHKEDCTFPASPPTPLIIAFPPIAY